MGITESKYKEMEQMHTSQFIRANEIEQELKECRRQGRAAALASAIFRSDMPVEVLEREEQIQRAGEGHMRAITAQRTAEAERDKALAKVKMLTHLKEELENALAAIDKEAAAYQVPLKERQAAERDAFIKAEKKIAAALGQTYKDRKVRFGKRGGVYIIRNGRKEYQ